MKIKQHERFQKIFYESLFLLNILDKPHEVIFKISGSTSNIYSVRIDKKFEWNNIFCDCPDAKKWANVHGVLCKHSIFVIFKVLKLFKFKNNLSTITTCSNGELFLENRKIHKDYIEVINIFLELFNINEGGDIIRKDYIEKYNQIKHHEDCLEKEKGKSMLEKRENPVEHCLVCFDDFDLNTMYSKDVNSQCLVCKNIFHKECLAKWFVHNKTCPYCRSPSSQNTDTAESNYINLFN